MKSVAIVLPAYNEAGVILKVLDGLPRKLKVGRQELDVQIIVVNDGSTDGTAKQVAKRRRVHLINHVLNSGAGAATRTGLHYALSLGVNYAVTMDSDGQHAANDIPKVLSPIISKRADMVIGSRLLDTKGMPRHRVIGNKGLSFITFLLFGVFVTDSQSGLRAYNQKALQKISFHSNNYAFCSEMIWKAKQAKLRIQEVPIKAIYTDYSIRKGQSNWNAYNIIMQLLRRRVMEILK